MSVEEMKVPGRNEPCHCGSGRKYKQCCLSQDEAKEREARTSATNEAVVASDAGAAKTPPQAPRHKTQQPWKSAANPRGFTRVNVPRRSGGS